MKTAIFIIFFKIKCFHAKVNIIEHYLNTNTLYLYFIIYVFYNDMSLKYAENNNFFVISLFSWYVYHCVIGKQMSSINNIRIILNL